MLSSGSSSSNSLNSIAEEVQEIPKDGRHGYTPKDLEVLTFPYYVNNDPGEEQSKPYVIWQYHHPQREPTAHEGTCQNGPTTRG